MGEVNMIDVDLAKYTLKIMATLSVQQKEKTFTSCDLYIGRADTRLLQRARHMAVPARRGAGLHLNRTVWVRNPREAIASSFTPRNKFRPDTDKGA
ncbi:hypothetical protein SAMN04488238_11644 [Roseicitreum antarcticum]|uniref:Uncharacterized protein n=2 Tax=Roseicitreum antarcticum TaxID=564137 RepID=A0A1H3DYA0_9RHOB|nr:hypothetical protein SAMN04488238_11644 [Roseicitreum antarcticum]